MTAVRLDVEKTILGGFESVPASITVRYVAGSRPYTALDGEDVRFSGPIRVSTDGEPVVLDLMPTRGRCAVMVTVEAPSVRDKITRTVEIPDTPTVDFADLIDVDPATYQPSAEGQAAWEAAVTEAQQLLDQVRGHTLTAAVSPDDPRLLRITYPSYSSPRPGVVRIPLEA